MPDPIFVICNPHAGRGKGGRLLPRLVAALRGLGREVEHASTSGPGQEEDLAARAIARGHRTLALVGGDGTWSQAAAAVIASGQPVSVGFVPAGTGADLARSFGMPRDPEGCARVLSAGRTRPMDAGLLEGRPFLNVAGFGYDVAVIEDTRRVRHLSGPLLYLVCAVRQVRSFSGFEVEVEVDGRSLGRRRALMALVSNGRAFGGGFRIWPAADLSDGRLEALVIHDTSVLGRLGLLQRVRRGRHLGTKGVEDGRGRTFVLRFTSPPSYEMDGEWRQARSAELRIETLPAALSVLAPVEA